MSLYNNLEFLFPYLTSIRKIQQFISIDVKFDNKWKIVKKYINEERFIENETKIPNVRSFSFVSDIDNDSLEKVLDNIKNLINYNIEREEKEKLFENKVSELKNIFEKENLGNLHGLKFEIKENNLTLEDNEEST